MSLSLLGHLARLVLSSGIRGRTRITLNLARLFEQLQALPISIDGAHLYLDLRIASSHALVTGQYPECDEQAVMRRLVVPGDIAFDIGAHLGLHTVLLSHLVGSNGRVYAFEPNPRVLPVLCRTVGRLT